MAIQQTRTYIQILEAQFFKYQLQVKEPTGVVVSGGIDSSIIACFVCKYFPHTQLLTVSTSKGVDKPFVELLGEHLQKSIITVNVEQEELQRIQNEIRELLNVAQVTINPMQQALASVYYCAFKEAHKRGIQSIFTGQGPDILLAGYSKYKKLQDLESNLHKEIVKDLPLLEIDGKRDTTMGKRWGITLINPYLEKEFVEFALSIPSGLLIHDSQEKYISRLVGKTLGLPSIIVNRPKKAMQYSTGIQRGIQNSLQ